MATLLRSTLRVPARLAAGVLALLTVGAGPASAAIAYGLRSDNTFVVFETRTPGTAIATVPITGLQPGETALAFDFRPATGQLYVLGSTSRIYVMNQFTGAAIAVGGPFSPALAGSRVGFDFNPVVDRIRVVGDGGQNLRLNPDTGAVAGVDGALNPGTPRIVASAYANNVAGAAATVLYGIDSATDQLFIQTPPNNGTQVFVGALGVDTTDDVGFDITAHDAIAYATLTAGAATSLYTIDLGTGAATAVGPVQGGPYVALAVVPSRGVPMVGLRNGTELIRFHSASPGTLLGAATVTGLQAGETLLGIDVRPANGQLYGVGSTGQLYVLNPLTGDAAAVGASLGALTGTRFGVDFNPVADRLRLVSDAEQNLRINADTGAVIADGTLTPAGTVVASAYTNNGDGLGTTTLFGIDAASDQLVLQNPPNNGTLTVVGALGVDASSDLGFDVSPFDNTAFAALTVGGVGGLYLIDLATGAATAIGPIGTGLPVNGLAALPVTYTFAEGSTGTFFDTDLLLANPTAAAVPVTITYLTDTARVVTQGLTLAPQSRTTVSADANALLGETAFSATVTSHLGIPIVAERTMRWDATGYGMHTEKAAAAPSRTWFFAEGAQGFYDTFFLLTNPGPAENSVTLQFLLENGAAVTRTYTLPARSRRTVYAGGIPELVNQSFGTAVTFAFAGAAERAMYFGTPVFNGGHESAGVTRPATGWFLAEGATGSFFTTFVLLANPNATPASVTLTYLREGGGTVTRTRTLAPGSRLTINVGLEDPTLAATSVATRVTSDVGIVAERAMYWPFSPASWLESHNAFGVTGTALRWGLAEGRVGGAFNFQTFVLVANPGATAATVTATFLRTTGAPVTKTFTVPAGARLTVTTGPGSMVPELADESFGVTLVSDVAVFAERALYSDAGGAVFAAGSVATATVLP